MKKAIHRLFQYIEDKEIKPTRLEKEIGLSNGYLGTQLKREADLGEGVLNKIVGYCLDINPEWLLTGNGPMLRTDTSAPMPDPIIVHERDPRDIELITTLKGMVETQKDLIVELKREKSAEGLGSGQRSAQTATYPYVGPQQIHK